MAIDQLKDKWVLVTGAGSGIGLATAVAFARAGASLVVTDVNKDRLAAAAAKIAALKRPCLAHWADVASETSMQDLAATVHARVGALDVLVNNAGIAYMGPFTDTPTAAWRRVLDVNVMGVVHGCQSFLPRMIAAGGSRQVVNVASLAAIAPVPNMSAYAASKSAVLGLSDVLAMELAGTAVGVTCVCPGIINTPIVEAPTSPAIGAAQLARLQAFYHARGCAPEVVADAIVAGVRQGREMVLVGPFAKPMYHLKRMSRALVRKLSLGNAEKVGFWPIDAQPERPTR